MVTDKGSRWRSAACPITTHKPDNFCAFTVEFWEEMLYYPQHIMTHFGHITCEVASSLGAGCLLVGAWIRLREMGARRWPQVTGRILTSRTKRHYLGQGRDELAPNILYEFTYRDRRYRTEHWRMGNYTPGFRPDAEAIIARFPAGTDVTVFVNRRRPRKSVLEHKVSPRCWYPIAMGIGFLIIAALPWLLTR